MDIGDAVQGVGPYAKIRANFYSKAFALLGYDAVGLGEMEVRCMDEQHDTKIYGKTPVINANVQDSSGKPLVPEPYIIKKTSSGLKVGIIAVLSDKVLFPGILKQTGVKVIPPEEALRKEVEELRNKADLIVVLSHAGQLSKDFANSVPGIDVVLSGHSMGMTMDAPEKVGQTILMAARMNSKYMGKLVLSIGADKKITTYSGEYVALDKSFQDDPDVMKLIADQDKELEKFYASLRTQETGPPPIPGLEPTEPRGPKPFVGASNCITCHAKEHESWSQTGHSKAFQALSKDNRQADPDCLSCHTTGFKSKGGFTSESETPDLKGVQCEVCHGPGVAHARRPKSGYGAVSELNCVQCHDSANSPHFDYKTYRSKIAHKKS